MMSRFDTVLVANRGEIALRIIRTARKMGLRTIAVFSDPDANAVHVRAADLAVRIGKGDSRESYQNTNAIIRASIRSGANAVHPGYGFLSENAEFAQAVADAGLAFIGPSASAIALMGNKAAAKKAMLSAGVPTVPGSDTCVTPQEFLDAAASIGYPVILKAAAGGGGRGMRLARDTEELRVSLPAAKSEARGTFGSDELILEKAIEGARHVEIQVLCDTHGRCVHLGERDCSVQRRYQKLIEESPSAAVSSELRRHMGAVSVAACEAISYTGVGTLEFLLDADGRFYFMEMNTRLQVEHGVTELLTGLDLVEWQFRIAQGEALSFDQSAVQLRGHAMELRVCAERPADGFAPQVGRIEKWRAPEAIRVDTALESGMEISPFYDSMLAKYLAWGETREDCIRKLTLACERTSLLGINTNLAFLQRCLAHPVFANGKVTTNFLADEDLAGAFWRSKRSEFADLAAVLALTALRPSLAGKHITPATRALRGPFELALFGPVEGYFPLDAEAIRLFQAEPVGESSYKIAMSSEAERASLNEPCVVEVRPLPDGRLLLEIEGVCRAMDCVLCGEDAVWVSDGALALKYTRATHSERSTASPEGPVAIKAPMSGQVHSILVAVGDSVEKGQALATFESMKMELRIEATCAGIILQIDAVLGDQVATGIVLMRIEPSSHSRENA